MAKPTVYRKKFFAREIILVDGHTRSCKSFMSPILASFEGVEILTVDNIFEHLAFLHHHNKIDTDGAVALLRCQLQYHMYYNMLSRNVNFKFGDFSGVFWNARPSRYIKRLFRKDKDVIEAIKKEKPLIQIQTHDGLAHHELFFETFGEGLKMIEMLRHPVDVIYSNYTKGYGKRESTEPTKTIFTMKHGDDIVPWYSYGWEDKYISLSQMDKVVHFVDARLKNIDAGYQRLSDEQKKQVILIPFEKFVTNPWAYIPRLEQFIGRQSTDCIKKALKKERCPRVLKEEDRKRKERKIRELASKESILIMEKLSREYEEFTAKL